MAKLNQTDEAWERLFEKYNILEVIERDGVFIISAQQIKEYREARLMTKFDHKANLPNLFKNNDLSILPNSRGTYVIGKFNAYQQLVVDDKKPISVEIPYYIESFDNLSITSESTALNVAHFTGMIDMVMETGNDEPNSVLTLSGRMSSGEIQYQIKGEKNFSYDFNVNNSQIEIDGSYENLQKIALIEAKSKLPLDFHIRQLYYPYRVYSNLIQKKEIMPVFFTFADDIFSFHIYKFNDLNDYNSIQKVEQVSFILNTVLDLNINEVKKISCNSPQLHSTEGVPFPQANSMGRILSILEYIKIPMNKNELAKICEFDIRQSDYYSNALIYLGLAKRNEKSEFVHTQLGSKISKMANNNERNKIIIESILKFKIFKKIFDSIIINGGEFDTEYIFKLVLVDGGNRISESTIRRRTSTVCAWMRWIFSVIE